MGHATPVGIRIRRTAGMAVSPQVRARRTSESRHFGACRTGRRSGVEGPSVSRRTCGSTELLLRGSDRVVEQVLRLDGEVIGPLAGHADHHHNLADRDEYALDEAGRFALSGGVADRLRVARDGAQRLVVAGVLPGAGID